MYPVSSGQPHGQLRVSPRPLPAVRCYGPFRSRKMARDLIEALAAHFKLALCPDDQPPPSGPTLFDPATAGQLCRRYYENLCSGPCADRGTRTLP